MAKCKTCGKTFSLFEYFTAFNSECDRCVRERRASESPVNLRDGSQDNPLPAKSDISSSGRNELHNRTEVGCFYNSVIEVTIIFAACAFVISLFSYFTADNPIAEQINMGTLLISGTIVGLLTAMKWLMGAMSTHLANQAKIIELMNKKDGDE